MFHELLEDVFLYVDPNEFSDQELNQRLYSMVMYESEVWKVRKLIERVNDKSRFNLKYVMTYGEYHIIHWICLHRNLEMLKLFLEHFPGAFKGNERSNLCRKTPLICYFFNDETLNVNPQMIHLLFENLPLINVKDQDITLNTAMNVATGMGDIYGIKYLFSQENLTFEKVEFREYDPDIPEEIRQLQREHLENPEKLRKRLRQESKERDSAEVMAMLPLIHEGYLVQVPNKSEKAQKFFAIASRLPLELQMLVSNYSQGIAKDFVSGKFLQEKIVFLLNAEQ